MIETGPPLDLLASFTLATEPLKWQPTIAVRGPVALPVFF
jgi:hypothetical protein